MIPVSSTEKTILIAPLNWGLGHASRSIPLIQQLLKAKKKVLIASDGDALKLLKKEVADSSVVFYELPAYNINYNSSNMSWNMIKQFSKIQKAIKAEHNQLKKILSNTSVDLIISDNRYGIYKSDVKSILLTHQLNAPKANVFQKLVFRNQINKWALPFNEIWIPDYENQKLSGKISEYNGSKTVRFIGPLSRFNKIDCADEAQKILVLLSGPEPRRSDLENQLATILKNEKVIFVRGTSTTNVPAPLENFEVYDLADSDKIKELLLQAKLVITRAGYSSIMDFARLELEVIMIPTPGQQEQEYLAEWLQDHPAMTFVSESNLEDRLPEVLLNYTSP